MKIIIPVTIDQTILNYSNVAEPWGGSTPAADPAEYLNSTTYTTIGEEVRVTATASPTPAIATHGIYENLIASNQGNDPSTGEHPLKWKFKGSTLKYAMFNQILQNQTQKAYSDQPGLTLNGATGNYASSADLANFPTKEIVITGRFAATDATPGNAQTIFSKYTEAADQRTLAVQLIPSGGLKLIVSADGTDSLEEYETDAIGFTNTEKAWFKIVFDSDNGAESIATFYYGLTNTDVEQFVKYEQAGLAITGAQTALFDSNAILELGGQNLGADNNFNGTVQQVTIYNGLTETGRRMVSSYNRHDPVTSNTSSDSLRSGQTWSKQSSAAFTEHVPGIVFQFTPGKITGALALMNMGAKSVQIFIRSTTDGEVYNQAFNLLSFLGIDNFFRFLFQPLEFSKSMVNFSLPAFGDSIITVVIASPNTAKCGAVVSGNEFVIGTSLYGASYGIKNYSQKSTDQVTGSVTIVKGTFKSVGDIDVFVEPRRFSAVLAKLTDLRDTPVVWVAKEGIEGTIQYGFYNSFDEIYQTYASAVCQLSIEGLG